MKNEYKSAQESTGRSRLRSIFGRRRNSTRRRSQRDRITYGELENRLVLATFIVTTAADNLSGTPDGVISLREAIFAANTNTAVGDAPAGDPNGDIIRFDPSINNSTINLTMGQIGINDDLMVQGGDSNITISGFDTTRLFDIAGTERVGFSKLTFEGGRAPVGGAMQMVGTGTTLLFEMTFTNNVATGDGGGAVYYTNGNMFVTNSTFTGNSATGSGSGGAIYQGSGNIYFNGGLMDGNSASGSGGAIASIGGTLFALGVTVGTITGGNMAVPDGSPIFSDGGGLHAAGNARVTVQGGEFVNNFAAKNGGAMWVGAGAQLFVRPGTDVNNNQAAGAGTGHGGGGIYNSGARLYVNRANISFNTAAGTFGGGGGIYSELGTGKTVLNNATVDNNAARRTGGGIHINKGLLQLTNSNVIFNDAGTTLPSASGHGGGIYAESSSTVVVNDGQVANNSATLQGGGIWGDTLSLVFVRNTANIASNTLSAAGAFGGGMYTQGFLRSTDSLFQRNTSTRSGGGLYLGGNINSRIDNTSFFENNGGVHGGGIFNDSSMYITNSTFAGNVVSVFGGAYFNSSSATTLAMGLTFTGNLPNDNN